MESRAIVENGQMSAIEKLLSDNTKVVINLKMKQNIKDIFATSNLIEKWAKNYDYSENQANGYRSLLEIASIYIRLVVNECERFGVLKVNDTSLVNLSIVLLNCLKTAVKLNEQDYKDNGDGDSNASMVIVQSHVSEENEQFALFKKDDTFIRDILFLMKNLQQSMISLSSRFAYFWMDKRFATCNKAMLLLMSLYATPMKCWYNIITDDSCRERAVQYAIDHQTFQFLTYFWSFPKQLFIDRLLFSYTNFYSQVNVKNILIPRQGKWKIDSVSCEVQKQSLDNFGYIEYNQSKARCSLISKNDLNKCENIILHCRGGMVDTQESHQPYLADWVNKMDKIPVLSVNYTSLSEGSVSVALQEILDVYIWLISNHHSVRQKLGYRPKKIVLCGHGIGGYIMMLLLFILNDIQLLINEETFGDKKVTIQRPTAIMCISTQFVYKLIMSPSRLLCFLDPLRNIPSICSVSETVVRNIVSTVEKSKAETEKVHSLFDRLLNILWEIKNKGLINKMVDLAHSWLKFVGTLINRFEVSPFKNGKNDWLIDDSKELQERISDYVNASIAPIFHRNFNSVSDVPLYLMTSEFDYTLDDNITMAKRWKGRVTLKCFKRLPHSFLRYFYVSEEARKASNRCLTYLLQSFGIEIPMTEEEQVGFFEFFKLLIENMTYYY